MECDRDALKCQLLNFFNNRKEALVPIVEICRYLGHPKKAINSVLYELLKSGMVDKVVESPPVWRLRSKQNIKETMTLPKLVSESGVKISCDNSVELSYANNYDHSYCQHFSKLRLHGDVSIQPRPTTQNEDAAQEFESNEAPNPSQMDTENVPSKAQLQSADYVTVHQHQVPPIQANAILPNDVSMQLAPPILPIDVSMQLAPTTLPIDVSMQLADRVLFRLKGTKESLTSSQLAAEEQVDEGIIKTVLLMLSAHQKVLYKGQTNSWTAFLPNSSASQREKLSDLELKILNQIRQASNCMSTIQIAKALGFKRKKELNPVLYGLQRQGFISKLQDVPPVWKCTDNPQEEFSDHLNENLQNVISNSILSGKVAVPAREQTASQNVDSGQNAGGPVKPAVDSVSSVSFAHLSNETFAALQKNPMSALHEYGQKNKIEAKADIVEQRGASHNPTFHCVVTVNNEVISDAWATNKRDAKHIAAERAVRMLTSRSMEALKLNVDSLGKITPFCDVVLGLSSMVFNSLLLQMPDYVSGRKVLATILMQTNENDYGQVVALGTGNTCISGQKLSLEGMVINDSHAEVITRRSLLRFLYKQLLEFSDDTPHRLFERCPEDKNKLRLKDNVKFHMYISTAPCGDAALFSRNVQPADLTTGEPQGKPNASGHSPLFTTSSLQGLLRAKIEAGEGTIPLLNNKQSLQAIDAVVHGDRLRTMSCSDKLARWNVLGLQGALLSNIIEPIYLSSITLGQLYHHGHLSRALCCRLEREGQQQDLNEQLGKGFSLHHPSLGQVSVMNPSRETERTKPFSINWVLGDQMPEVTNGATGVVTDKSGKCMSSRVCKSELFGEFKSVCSALGLTTFQGETYWNCKQRAVEYQTSKAALMSHIQSLGYGIWLQKPEDGEMFI